MKNILITASFIAGLLSIACANTTSNTAQEKTPIENQQYNQPIPLFTPEEIAYNDSIKNLPMDYVQVEEWVSKDMKNPSDLNKRILKDEFKSLTQEEAYLKAYHTLCFMCQISVSDYVSYTTINTNFVILEGRVKLLNKDGKDIVPLIDFPDRRAKEDSIWNIDMEFIKNNPLEDIRFEMYKQPIINKGDALYAKFGMEILDR